tara:strand:+ start:252 stop:554 length:303 start_codon:yes stop_codon:yes gene_type:complete
VDADIANTLIEQGILGLWCLFMIFLYHQGNKRAEKLEEKRDADRKDADERLDELISKMDVVISRLDALTDKFEEKAQEDKMRQYVREAARGRVKTETKIG